VRRVERKRLFARVRMFPVFLSLGAYPANGERASGKSWNFKGAE
jgi:hypothetical protein